MSQNMLSEKLKGKLQAALAEKGESSSLPSSLREVREAFQHFLDIESKPGNYAEYFYATARLLRGMSQLVREHGGDFEVLQAELTRELKVPAPAASAAAHGGVLTPAPQASRDGRV